MQERVVKAIAERDRRSSGSRLEGRVGTALVVHEEDPLHNEV